MLLFEIVQRIRFWEGADRLGPDMPSTHLRLHVKSSMLRLCRRKFKSFDDTADFRPGAYAVTCSKISIGRGVVIRPGSVLMADPSPGPDGSIVIEDGVLMGSGIHIYVANHRFDDRKRPVIEQGHFPAKSVTLKKGCWIGANAVILPGVTVGENAVVGAGSIVTRSVPAGAVAAGNPAKILRPPAA